MLNENTISREKNLFLTGIFRSGTTLLSRSLSVHPKIIVVYQLFFPFFRMWRDLFLNQMVPGMPVPDRPMGSNVFFDAGVFDLFSKSGSKVYFSDHNIDELENILVKELQRDKHEKPFVPENAFVGLKEGNGEEILLQLLERSKDSCGGDKEIFGFKEIWCEDFAPALLNTKMLNIKCLQVLRDPRGIFSSRNTGKYLQECGGKKYPLLFIVESWRRSVRIAEMLSNVPSFCSVLYEDFVNRPEEVVINLCSFLEVDFCTDMVKPEKFTDGKGNAWKPNTTGNNSSLSFNKDPLFYWQKALSDEEVGSVEFLCGGEMESLGYEKKFTQHRAKDLFMSYYEKEEEMHPWLHKFGYTCDAERKEIEMQQRKKVYES